MFHVVVILFRSLFSFHRGTQNSFSTFRSRFIHVVLFAGLLAQGITPAHAAGNKGLPANVSLEPLSGPVLSPLMTPYAWDALGDGLNGNVFAIAINGTDIYVGGTFTDAGGDPSADGIAKWDGASWSALGTGLNGQVNTIAVFAGSIYVGGTFTDAGGDSDADYIARWDGSTWSTVGNGLGSSVSVIGVDGSNFYIAGAFLDAGGVSAADYIAKLDGGSWESLGATPLNGSINSIVVAGATVYAGGDFANAGGDPNADRIAQWDGASWSAMGSGLSDSILALAMADGYLYAGGYFINAGGNGSADYIAKWDGTSWSALGTGLNAFSGALAVDGSNLYVGGNFLNAGGHGNADYIAKWDGTSWSALGTTPLSGTVAALAVNGLDIYAGGVFDDAGGNSGADKIARFELTNAPLITSFAAVSSSPGLNIPISMFTASDNAAVTAYLITDSSTTPSADDAGWTTSVPMSYTVASDGSYTLYPWAKDAEGNISPVYGSPVTVDVDTTPPTISTDVWNPLGSGLSNTAYDIAFSGSDVYVVGSFLDAGSYVNGDRVAKWNGTSWSPLGSGFNAQTEAVAVNGSSVYAGGYFSDVAGIGGVNNIAQWNGSDWSDLDTPIGGNVNEIAINGSDFYAGGGFQNAGANANADYVARLNGGIWESLGTTPLNGSVFALALDGSNVYVGGAFTDAGGNASADYIAKWDGTAWSALGSGLNGGVRTIVVSGGIVYAGGNFTDAGGNGSADRIAQWNGTSWSSLGTGLNGMVNAIAVSGSTVYAGGLFTDAGGDSRADYVAAWKPATGIWSPLGDSGLNGAVEALAINGPYLYAGGSFTDAGGNASADRIALFVIDTASPTVTSFSAPSSSNSFDIPITTFNATDDTTVTGYLVTETSTPPSAGAAGWTSSAPTSYTVADGGSHTLYPWVKDGTGQVSGLYGAPITVTVDTSAPAVDSFAAPALTNGLNVPITSFTASDGIGVGGYLITETDTVPSSADAGWTASAPTTYMVASAGLHTLYPWVKDAAGNVSSVYGAPASVMVDATLPTVTAFSVPSVSNSLNIPITTFTASDNIFISGYRITQSSTPPSSDAAGWTGSAPSAFTVGGSGSQTLYPWVKDSAGNVSAVYGSPASVLIDTSVPSVTYVTSTSNTGCLLNSGITYCNVSDVVHVQITFNEAVYVTGAPKLDLMNSAKATYASGSGTNVLTFHYTVASGEDIDDLNYLGSSALTLNGGTIRDAATNNANLQLPTMGSPDSLGVNTNIAVDTNVPTVSYFHRRNPLSSATNSDMLYFEVIFSEQIGGPGQIDISDFELTGTPGTTATITDVVWIEVSSATYEFQVSGGDLASYNGTVGLSFSDGMLITDRAGNPVPDSDPGDNEMYTVDNAAPAVDSFTAPSSTASLVIPITVFGASDNTAVTGYLITTSATPPSAGDSSWTGSAPINYTVADNGSYTLYPWVKDASGNVSILYGSPANVTVDTSSDAIAPTVDSFTVPTFTASLDIQIGTFTASDNIAVTGYLITESATPPSAGDSGWTGSAPTTYTVASDGSYLLYPWVKDEAGHVSVVYSSPASITVDRDIPVVLSSTRANANFTNLTSVGFSVSFSKEVTGVDAADFSLFTTGVTGASIANVTGGPSTYTVTVTTGSGNGTIRLDVQDDDSIMDASGNPLAGPGTDNGDFTSGEVYSIVKSAAIPGVPTLLSPADSALVTSAQPLLDWNNSVPAAHHYKIQIATNSTFTNLVVNESNVSTSAFTPATPLIRGQLYYWRVRALNVINGASGWSAVRSFKTPLARPILGSPIGGVSLVKDRTSLGWSSVDGATQYLLQVSTVSNFGSLLVNVNVNTNEYDISMDLPQDKMIYWRVRAKTSVVTGSWSVTESFKTGNPPTVPVLVAPINNGLIQDYTPVLDWNNSTVPVGTTFSYYILEVDDDSNFSSPVITGTPAVSKYLIASDLASNTKYYWRVAAANLVGGVEHFSAWSPVWSFRTVVAAPTLQVPDVNADTLSLRPLFDWAAPSGPGAITGYTIQISKNNTFTLIVQTANPTASKYTPTADLPKGITLYWRVLAKGANGPSAWSTARVFNSANPPTTPVLNSPAQNTVNTNYLPLLKWSAVTLPLGTNFANYQVQLDDQANFSVPEIDHTFIVDRLNTQLQVGSPLAPNTKFYWRVRAFNTDGEASNWSPVFYFHTALAAPTGLNVVSTANPLRPLLDWENATGTGAINGYNIQVSTSASFSTPLVNATTVSSAYSLLTNLPAGRTIYWRVRVTGANGTSAWTTAQFVTE